MHQFRLAALVLMVVAVAWAAGSARVPVARAAECLIAEPFAAFAEALGGWTVGTCAADPTTDPDGSLHQETDQGTLHQFAGAERPVFREPSRLWIDGPGGIAREVRVSIPAGELGDSIDVRQGAAVVLERAALDEPSMPMGWEALQSPTGRVGPASSCQTLSDELVLGRVQTMFGDERGRVRVLQSVSALRDGGGPQHFARLRTWLATCQEWQTTLGDQQFTFRSSVQPLAPLGEDSVRYLIETQQKDAPTASFVDTVVVRYGDLLTAHSFLMTEPGEVLDGDLIGIAQLTEAKLRAALREPAAPAPTWEDRRRKL